MNEQGKISVETENIFPIIKKWLYSEKDIFLRELISNSTDAITKLKKIALSEEFEGGTDYQIKLSFDKEKRTLSIEDNGIGMTGEEIKKYINQIAFSGAEDFIKKYEKDSKAGIIGHFGLGFYSSFMVSTKVEIETKSYKKDSKGVKWESESGTEFKITEIDKKDRGTKITLILDSDSGEYLDKWKLKELVKKYCDFLPIPITVEGEEANKKRPLWSEQPSSLKKEDYTEFYNYLFPFSGEPHFWVHLNVDYPFKLQGILYFPKLKHELDASKNGVKLYCNHVFVSDESSELIPQFLTVLKGTIDIPDLPLNVSRSYLQNDPLVKKISSHIMKKITDRLSEDFKKDRAEFEKNWEEMSLFVKFGMISEEKFYEGAKDVLIFKSTNGNYTTLNEYWDKNKENNKNTVYYATETEGTSVFMDLFKSQGLEAILVDSRIDSHLVQFLETKNPDMKFKRVDSDIAEQVVSTDQKQEILDSNNKTEKDRIKEFFTSAIGKEGMEIKVEALKSSEVPAVILLPEFLRRMTEMNAGLGQDSLSILKNHSLVLNSNSKLVKNALKIGEGPNTEKGKLLARHIYDLALLSSKAMDESEIGLFIKRSNQLLEEMSN
ncbi:MAG: molecular chaperone HtpG [Leptospiraceae bacterium]|nr:molecular chaperone HtpG [Leptospiraceae bacterium]MCK6380785.1 molecular chaperone HtpG [Leptospiraceae bacterium]NUM40498.1 molecular chaperone HtpG [Leptospiraceae bacterium]